MATQELHLDSDYLGTQASCPDIKNFHVRVCSENNDCINPGDLSGRSGRDKYGVPRNQTGNLSVKVKEEEDVRSDIPQACVTGNSSMTNKSNSEGNLNAKSDTNSDFQTKSELVGVNLGHESMMKVYEHISRFSHQKASDFEFKIDGGETSESIPRCVNDGFGIQTGKCMDLLNVKVKEEAAVTNNKWNVVECAVHNKTQKESNPCKCVNVKTDFTLMERETGVRQDVHGNQSMIANSHSIACHKADASVPKMLIRENSPEDQGKTRNDVHGDTCSRHWKENPQIFPIALNQIRIKLPITEEIQQQLHQECLQEQREGNQTHGEKMEEENEIKSQSYMYGCQRKSDPNKVLHQEERPTYACRQCDKVFLTYGGRTRHEELHLALTFKCDMCSSTFKKQNYLRDHIMRVHRQKDLECEICGKVYGYKKALKLHMSTCILRKQATEVHSFEQGKTFGVNLHQLKDHIKRTHDMERLQKSNVSCESLPTGSVPEQHTESHQELTSHECDVCHKSCKSMDILRTHKLLHQEERPTYACRQCDKVFLTYGGRTRHEELHLALTFKCDMCSSTFKKQNYLRDHIMRVHRQKDLECEICGKVYGYKKALKLHMSTCILRKQATEVHSFEQGKTFGVNLHQLKDHTKRTHDMERLQKSNVSSESLPTGSVPEQHTESHQELTSHECDVCHKSYKSIDILRTHKLLHQEERPTYACRHCDKVFLTYGGRSRHEELHLALTFKCDMCSLTFKKQKYLRNHIERIHVHHQKDHECKICGKVFGYQKTLKRHMSIHTQLPVNAINEESGKAFEDQKSLGNHMLSHSCERPYQCRYCEKTYKSAYNCDKHMATVHNNPKPNCCRYCFQRFSSKNSLLLHVEAVHSESPITICAHCGRCFTTEVALKRHQGTQICRDSILCEQCGKIVSKQSIKKHLKSHKNSDKKDRDNTNQTGLYVCAICKKSLKSKIARRYHMRVHLSEDINV